MTFLAVDLMNVAATIQQVAEGGEEDGAQGDPEVPQPQSVPKGPSSRGAQFKDQGHRVSRDPDQAVADAQVRVGKLEAAIAARGEDDSAVLGLKDALERVRCQAQARPVNRRIQWTQVRSFAERHGGVCRGSKQANTLAIPPEPLRGPRVGSKSTEGT